MFDLASVDKKKQNGTMCSVMIFIDIFVVEKTVFAEKPKK